MLIYLDIEIKNKAFLIRSKFQGALRLHIKAFQDEVIVWVSSCLIGQLQGSIVHFPKALSSKLDSWNPGEQIGNSGGIPICPYRNIYWTSFYYYGVINNYHEFMSYLNYVQNSDWKKYSNPLSHRDSWMIRNNHLFILSHLMIEK